MCDMPRRRCGTPSPVNVGSNTQTCCAAPGPFTAAGPACCPCCATSPCLASSTMSCMGPGAGAGPEQVLMRMVEQMSKSKSLPPKNIHLVLCAPVLLSVSWCAPRRHPCTPRPLQHPSLGPEAILLRHCCEPLSSPGPVAVTLQARLSARDPVGTFRTTSWLCTPLPGPAHCLAHGLFIGCLKDAKRGSREDPPFPYQAHKEFMLCLWCTDTFLGQEKARVISDSLAAL